MLKVKQEKIKPGVASVEREVPGLGDNHIDFFVLPLSERNKARFKVEDNITIIPEHHQRAFYCGLYRCSHSMTELSFILVSFHKAGEDKQTFKYITYNQYKKFRRDSQANKSLTWDGPKEEL